MKPLSRDTSPDAEAVQIRLLRAATPARRFSLVRSLSGTAIALARRGIRRARPGASETEVLLEFVAIHYGEELAEAVRKDLAERRG